jgi:hypothetical protein
MKYDVYQDKGGTVSVQHAPVQCQNRRSKLRAVAAAQQVASKSRDTEEGILQPSPHSSSTICNPRMLVRL